MLQLLSKSLDVVESEDWIADLGETFGSQIPLYHSYPEEKVCILYTGLFSPSVIFTLLNLQTVSPVLNSPGHSCV